MFSQSLTPSLQPSSIIPSEFLEILKKYSNSMESVFIFKEGEAKYLTITRIIEFNKQPVSREYLKFTVFNGIINCNQFLHDLRMDISTRNKSIIFLFENKYLDRDELSKMFNLHYSTICQILSR